MSPKLKKSEWYIHDQTWSLLDVDPSYDPTEYLTPVRLRARETRVVPADELFQNHWKHVTLADHNCIALNRHLADSKIETSGCFKYIVFTSEAGGGKTKTTQWLEYRINHSDSDCLAFRFDIRQVVATMRKESASDDLLLAIAMKWSDATHSTLRNKKGIKPLDVPTAKVYLTAYARQGRLCLIFDGLDQATSEDITILSTIIESPMLRLCRFVVAGRTDGVITNQEVLFAKKPWRYVKLEEFSRDQQIRYLGWLDNGEVRYFQIPKEARSILTVPRVLSYLRSKKHFQDYRKTADVYYFAIRDILEDCMSRSRLAARIGLEGDNPMPDELARVDVIDQRYVINRFQIVAAMNLLAVVAFVSLTRNHRVPPSWTNERSPDTFDGDHPYPYVHEVLRKRHATGDGLNEVEFDEVRDEIKSQCERLKLSGNFDRNWIGIATLNSQFLEQGIFEDSKGKLDQIVWANKSLHEFLLAFYFSCLATSEDCQRLWDWIVIKDQVKTQIYFQFWCFLTEMHFDAIKPEVWLESIAMLYQLCQPIHQSSHQPHGASPGSPLGQNYFAKRSTEMIYRSWWQLQHYANREQHPKAQDILSNWLGEFERIKDSGDYGSIHQQTASDIVNHFLPIPGGDFIMRTLSEKQGFQIRRDRYYWEGIVSKWTSSDAIRSWFDAEEQTPSWQSLRDRYERQYINAFNRGGQNLLMETVVSNHLPSNEMKQVRSVESYLLGRRTISNHFYRLFDPGHFVRMSETWDQSYAPSPEHNAICLDWFDGWVYTRWLHWDGLSCRMPYEDEWEYGAKYGFGADPDRWHWRYWWGDDFDAERDQHRINCFETNGKSKKVLQPNRSRASDATRKSDCHGDGLMDMLGNLWQWCMDARPNPSENYPSEHCDLEGNAIVLRSRRGGSFDFLAIHARCSVRFNHAPSNAQLNSAIRVARAELQKS